MKDLRIGEMNDGAQIRKGLSKQEAESRLAKYGHNSLIEPKRKSWILKFLAEFNDLLIIILLAAAIIAVIVDPHEWVESVIILVVVIINALLGVIQESRAERSLEALKKLSTPLAKVFRDGVLQQIESSELVPGDIITFEAGDYIPTDARLIEVVKLQVDESALTGESMAVQKTIDAPEGTDIPLGDQKNMVFSSTFVTYGRGIAEVTATGMQTQIGKIAEMILEHKIEMTPLQRKLNQIGSVIGMLALLVCVVVFFMEWLVNKLDILFAFETAVALAVAAIPEGLSTVVTIVLAFGVEKMAKERAIVKKLSAVETLGCTNIICSDKTGTLTQNKMTVVSVYTDRIQTITEPLDKNVKEMLTYLAICCDAEIRQEDGVEKRLGDPTETALIEANQLYGAYHQNWKEQFPRVAELSFDSDRKMMSVIIKYRGRFLLITKGAPDIILNRCISTTNKAIIQEANQQMADRALRVLGIGVRVLETVPMELESEIVEQNLTFIGLVGMIDPPRDEVRDAIASAKQAGIRTIMITGDHVATAKAIAKDLALLEAGQEAISTQDLALLSDAQLEQNIDKYGVYARVTPTDKVRIVTAWQKRGNIVAMTGDGVNDSPALKTADIGCAMGITGTDVAKEAAAMILVDDNFATIITAVREGRGIYKNIKKTVQYLLSSNIGEVLTIFMASLLTALIPSLTLGVPLLPIHLLWVNLITDSLPAFALGMEHAGGEVMNEKPRPAKESFFANGLGFTIIWQGILVGTLTLIAYIYGLYLVNWDLTSLLPCTMAFMTLSLSQLVHAFNLKSELSIFNRQIFNNKYLWGAFALGLGLELLIIYIPALANIFNLVPLDFEALLVCLGLSFMMFVVVEIVKLVKKINRRYRKKNI